jgi:hypothetical protein
MIQHATPALFADLYEVDETAWLEEMGRLLADRRFQDLDIDHLAEFLTDIAKQDKREVLSRLAVLLAHLLKWEHQPDQRTQSWRATIDVQRDELADLLDSESLRQYAEQTLDRAYQRAVRQTSGETGLPLEAFAQECQYSLDQIMKPAS